jgi:acyl carrier protein
MEREEVKEKVIQKISDHLSKDAGEIHEESDFTNDLGADSLDIVELVMELEETFDIQIPDDETEKLKTVGDVINYISQHK